MPRSRGPNLLEPLRDFCVRTLQRSATPHGLVQLLGCFSISWLYRGNLGKGQEPKVTFINSNIGGHSVGTEGGHGGGLQAAELCDNVFIEGLCDKKGPFDWLGLPTWVAPLAALLIIQVVIQVYEEYFKASQRSADFSPSKGRRHEKNKKGAAAKSNKNAHKAQRTAERRAAEAQRASLPSSAAPSSASHPAVAAAASAPSAAPVNASSISSSSPSYSSTSTKSTGVAFSTPSPSDPASASPRPSLLASFSSTMAAVFSPRQCANLVAAHSETGDEQLGGADNTCVVCMDAAMDAGLLHAGSVHVCCCMKCAQLLHESGDDCPLCRVKIESVVRAFVAS